MPIDSWPGWPKLLGLVRLARSLCLLACVWCNKWKAKWHKSAHWFCHVAKRRRYSRRWMDRGGGGASRRLGGVVTEMPLVCLGLCGSNDSDNKFKHFAALRAIHSLFLPPSPSLYLFCYLSPSLVLATRARFACVLIVNLHFAVFIATLWRFILGQHFAFNSPRRVHTLTHTQLHIHIHI